MEGDCYPAEEGGWVDSIGFFEIVYGNETTKLDRKGKIGKLMS